jgi:hypothetical protein
MVKAGRLREKVFWQRMAHNHAGQQVPIQRVTIWQAEPPALPQQIDQLKSGGTGAFGWMAEGPLTTGGI